MNIDILGQLGDFFAGLGNVFSGLKKALGVVLDWVGQKASSK